MYLSMYSVLIPISLGIVQFKKLNSYLLLLFLLIIFSPIPDFLVFYKIEAEKFICPLFIISQYILLALIFIGNNQNPQFRKSIRYSIPIFFIYSFLYIFILEEHSHLFPNLMTVTLFAFLIISITSLIKIYNNTEFENLFSYPFFYINVAVLIYFSGNIFLTLSCNIYSINNVIHLYVPINSILNITKNLLFAMAFLVHFYNSRKESMR